ncbi:ECF RNA polymerase sigma factor SigK [Amycolatopsis sp. H20-H5]|nr:ECF RNA polymerase sigma factor SigK [Amycolatopsis sp. H20-H5]MEC3980712.1 ECF RNA polymerase sigma factor SigK [Amycolatopsis sp. H20-H5]
MHTSREELRFTSDTPREPTAEALIARVARGDERAFEALYELCSARVYGVIRRLLLDAAQAEEVSQEVWLQVWRSAPGYAPERGSAMTWLLTLAHRRAVDRVRSAQAAGARERSASFESARDRPFDQVSETAVTRAEQRQVRRCLTALTELQRQAVVMAYYHGSTYREVAEALDVPLATVKTRMRDGLIRLRDCLQGNETTA